MLEFVKVGGFLMLPILICSVIALAIILQRFIALRSSNVIPSKVIKHAHSLLASGKPLAKSDIQAVNKSSLIGTVLASGLANANQPRHIMKESLEEAGRHAAHKMDRYMTTLGTIASITPLLGLLGTVIGMIDVFSVMTAQGGIGNPTELAGGISKALVTTAAGISIAVIAMIFHRYFKSKINDYTIEMEQNALKMVEISGHMRTPTGQAKAPVNKQAEMIARARAEQLINQKKRGNT